MVLIYVISVIMMEYTIEYRDICYLVNRSWHTAVCAVQTKPLTAAKCSYVHLFTTLMFTPTKSQS